MFKLPNFGVFKKESTKISTPQVLVPRSSRYEGGLRGTVLGGSQKVEGQRGRKEPNRRIEVRSGDTRTPTKEGLTEVQQKGDSYRHRFKGRRILLSSV